MSIEYRFLERGDDALVQASELPVEGGIAVAVRTTGYEAGRDEVLRLSIVGLDGEELFSQTVRPQNVEEWGDGAASGGITPADVREAPELYQFEDEIAGLFEGASVVVCQHADFVREAIEASWVSLPAYEPFDLVGRFCASHCSADYPGRPAAAATLEGIAGYYGLPADESDTVGVARAAAASYLALVGEHVAEREAKGPQHWADYERGLEEAAAADGGGRAAERAREVRTGLVNALLWLCGAAIFSNLAVQTYLAGPVSPFFVVTALAAAFCAVRWAMCLLGVRKLRQRGK